MSSYLTAEEMAEAEANALEKISQLMAQQLSLRSSVIDASKCQTGQIPLPKPLNVKTGKISDNIRFFRLQWSNYMVASGLSAKSEDVKKSTLLSVIGDECLKLYHTFNLTAADVVTETSLMDAIERNLMPVLNIRYERAMFNLATQKQNCPFDVYLKYIRDIMLKCEFGDREEEVLLDKIICSVHDVKLREQLWTDKDITLSQALEMCRAREALQLQLRHVKEAVPVQKQPPQQARKDNNRQQHPQASQQRDERLKQNRQNKQQGQPITNVTIIQNLQDSAAQRAREVVEKPVSQKNKKSSEFVFLDHINKKEQTRQAPSRQIPTAPKQQSIPKKRCTWCGRENKGEEHSMQRSKCPAYGKICNNCGRGNHFDSVCRAEVEEEQQNLCKTQ